MLPRIQLSSLTILPPTFISLSISQNMSHLQRKAMLRGRKERSPMGTHRDWAL